MPEATKSKPDDKIGLPEAVKRMDKALKRETGTPPKPYRPMRTKKQTAKSKDIAK
jgi:hypothetical protein